MPAYSLQQQKKNYCQKFKREISKSKHGFYESIKETYNVLEKIEIFQINL